MTISGLRRFYPWLLLAGVMCLVVLGVWLFCFFIYANPDNEAVWPMSFDDSSDKLQQTVVVPTLDTPIPENKSAIWSSSFQLAWNRLKTDVVKEPVHLKNAEPIAEQLNRAEQSESDLDPQDIYAAAGLVKVGIVPRIQAEMARKFPDVPMPQIESSEEGAIAYGYLRARVKFTLPYFDNDEEFLVSSASGSRVAVKSFGIRKKDDYAYRRLRDQLRLLYYSFEVREKEIEGLGEFIVDPCQFSKPYQLILAAVSRKPTLAEALAEIDKKTIKRSEEERRITPRDVLLVPSMHWRIRHRFQELEGRDKRFHNETLQGLYLDTAMQMIQFSLDRGGAELASEAKLRVKPSALYLHFDHPFLIILKKRDAKQPVFVMWVANAELMEKFHPQPNG